MKRLIVIPLIFSASLALSAAKVHVVAFGKLSSAQWLVGPEENKPYEMKVRGLFVDGRLREYTAGPQHELTERVFVVRRIFRLNDSLPGEATTRWKWQRGG